MAEFTGDRPRFGLVNQRLDKPDMNAVSELINKTIVRTVGNIMGPSWGCLTKPTFDTSLYAGTSEVQISACTFGYVWPSTAQPLDMEGAVVIYDPDRPLQSMTSITIPSGLGNEDTAVWLWFFRSENAGPTDMRASWPTNAEVVSATGVQTQEFVLFVSTPLTGSVGITEANGWFRFARVPASGWTGTVGSKVPAEFEVLSFYDGWYTQVVGASGMNADNRFGHFAFDPPLVSPAGPATRWGLVQYLQGIINQLAIILDTANYRDDETDAAITDTDTPSGENVEAGSFLWKTRPAAGLKQHEERIAELEDGIDGVIATYLVHWNSGLPGYVLESITESAAVTASSVASSDIDGDDYLATLSLTIATGWTVTGYHVTPITPIPDPVPANVTSVNTVSESTTNMPFAGTGVVKTFLVAHQYFDLTEAWGVDARKYTNSTFTFTLMGKRT